MAALRHWLGFATVVAAFCCARGFGDEPKPQDRDFFETKVRPILVERCYECHSARAKNLRGGLRLDYRDGWTKGGDSGPTIEPGDPENSLLVLAIRYDDEILKMPPKGRLPDGEIAVLTDWVKRGALDPRTESDSVADTRKPARAIDHAAGRAHWAFRPLSVVEPPRVQNEVWCRTPVDRFILAKLEAKGLSPRSEAPRRVLIRRAFFDLIGLPPEPEEIDAFEQDCSGDTFDRLVNRLLESAHYGERWARHWLDLARWGESHGFEHDYDRPSAYHYRDFVIEAFNRDLPYDTFVKWQLAGDEYAPDDSWALRATGFLGAGTHNTQITKNQVEKERYDELDDMINTAGTAYLGLSIGCARCHDHKYDPITTKEYYQIASTFTTTVRAEIDLVDPPETISKALSRYEREHQRYRDLLAAFEAVELPRRLERWEASHRLQPASRPRWVVLEPSKIESKGGARAKKLDDGSLLFEGPNAEFDVYAITAACDLAEITAVRIEALAEPSLPAGGPGRAGNGNFALSNLKLTVGPRYGIGATSAPRLVNPKATIQQDGFPIAAALDEDPKSAWAVDPQVGEDHAAVFEIGSNLRTDSGCTLTFTLEFQNNSGHNLGRVRLSATDSPRPVGIDDDGIPPSIRAILDTPAVARCEAQRAAALDWYKTIDMNWRALNQDIEDHSKTKPTPEGVKALVCTEGLAAVRLHTQGDDFLPETHVLRRGDPNQKEGVADQSFLMVLTTAPDGEKHWQIPPPQNWRTSYRRRALAEWMTDAEHGAGHLLARVIVNRLWQHHFGRGLVATPSDFGAQGTPPTHPELLDWLADRLIQNGWHLKPIHKIIMTSAVYRQGSRPGTEGSALDLDNALYGRQQRRRLEAEAIRDAMLAVSGVLDPRMFGPGSLDERMRRRGIYFTVKRSKLIPMMTLFDAPDALVPIPARSSTIVAPQSLYLMNSPVVREWAAAFAERVRPGENETVDDAVLRAFRLALGRPPSPDELATVREFLARQQLAHSASTSEESRMLALTDFCQVLFCSNEFTYVE